MKHTISVALAVCGLTALFLAVAVEQRPVQLKRHAPEPLRIRPRKPKPPSVAVPQKGVVEVWLMQGTLLHTAKTRIEAVSATEPAARQSQEVTGGVGQFAGLAPGEWLFSAATATHASPTVIARSGDKAVRIELPMRPAGRIRGVVRDANGTPLREASVVAQELIGNHGPGAPREAMTSADGAFEFAFLAEAKYELVVCADGCEPASRQVEVKSGQVTENEGTSFHLAPVKWGKVRGVVLDAEGKPVGGVTLRIEPAACRIVRPPDASGAFEIEAPPGRMVLAAAAPGYAMEIRDDIVVEKGGDEEVEIRLGRGAGIIEGCVLLANGEPATGALVECIQGSGEPGTASSGTVASTRTDAQGRFVLRGFVEGVEVGLRISATGYPPQDVGVVRVPLIDFEVVVGEVRHAVLGGRVTTAEPPTEELQYQLKLWRIAATGSRRLVGVFVPGTPSSSHDPQFTAGEGGEFTFQRLTPGTYAIAASAPGFAPTEVGPLVVPAEALLTGIAVKLGKGQSISGRVVGAGSGTKIAGVRVAVLNAAGEPVAAETQTDGDGMFVIPNLGPGRYALTFRHEAYRETRKEIEVVPDMDVVGLRIPMDDSPTLVGKVIDAEGKPVEDGTVVALREGERREGELKNGRYEIRGLSGGVYTVWASSPGRGQVRASGVSVSMDGRTVRDLRLSPGGTLRITVKAGDTPVAGARASFRWKDGVEVGTLALRDSAGQPAEGTDAHGVLVILNVPSEPLVLRVTKGGTTREIDVCVPEGATLAIPVRWAE